MSPCQLLTHRKIPKILAPGILFFKGLLWGAYFLRALYSEGFIYGGKFALQNRWKPFVPSKRKCKTAPWPDRLSLKEGTLCAGSFSVSDIFTSVSVFFSQRFRCFLCAECTKDRRNVSESDLWATHRCKLLNESTQTEASWILGSCHSSRS